MNKREFMKTTAAVFTAASLPLQARESTAIAAIVFDERFSDARAFARQLEHMGARAFATAQNAGRLCYGALREYISRPGVQLAGFTPYSDVYVVQTFATGHRLRLLFEGIHDCRRSSTLRHELSVSEALSGLASKLENAGPQWSTLLARTVGSRPLSKPVLRESVRTSTDRATDNPGMLVSWVLG
jgi:hypothetical protein